MHGSRRQLPAGRGCKARAMQGYGDERDFWEVFLGLGLGGTDSNLGRSSAKSLDGL